MISYQAMKKPCSYAEDQLTRRRESTPQPYPFNWPEFQAWKKGLNVEQKAIDKESPLVL